MNESEGGQRFPCEFDTGLHRTAGLARGSADIAFRLDVGLVFTNCAKATLAAVCLWTSISRSTRLVSVHDGPRGWLCGIQRVKVNGLTRRYAKDNSDGNSQKVTHMNDIIHPIA